MTPYERLERIVRCAKLRGWETHHMPHLGANQRLFETEDRYSGRSYGGGNGNPPPTKKWVGSFGGLVAEGDTPEEVAEKLEAVVFGALLKNLDDAIMAQLNKVHDLTTLKRTLADAMGSEPNGDGKEGP